MTKIRIPKSKIPEFKSYSKIFSKYLEEDTGVRLRGNKLLNMMSRAAGHNHYKSLTLDSGAFGDGQFTWELIPFDISQYLSNTLNIHVRRIRISLIRATLSNSIAVKQLYAASLKFVDGSVNSNKPSEISNYWGTVKYILRQETKLQFPTIPISDPWVVRAKNFLSSISEILDFKYKSDELKKIDIDTYTSYLELQKVCSLVQKDQLPEIYSKKLLRYLGSLGQGLTDAIEISEIANGNNPADKLNEQHGYIVSTILSTGLLNDKCLYPSVTSI